MKDPVITCPELHERIDDPDVVVLDGSWYLPGQGRDAREEFAGRHIPGARFFDIDRISDPDTDLPHMVPTPDRFAREVESLGVSSGSRVVVYDGMGLFSAARVWWLFRVFGHEDVSVLAGGLPEWERPGYPTTGEATDIRPGSFRARFDPQRVASMDDITDNLETRDATVLDARPQARFLGRAPEPRPELPSGHMPGAVSLPFTDLLREGQLKPDDELGQIFEELGIRPDTPLITSCGSGVTASVITLALCRCGHGLQRLYDGSWTEWAGTPGNPIASDPAGD